MDRRAIAAGTTEAVLMERAAGHLARTVLAVAGRTYGAEVAILCGKGNNGGDGLAAARQLLGLGAAPRVALVDDDLDGLVAQQRARYLARGGRIFGSPEAALDGACVAVDCLLGTGASGAPRGDYVGFVEALRAATCPVVACDLPSGVNADTGDVPGPAVRADVTLTLGAHKRGLALHPASDYAGRVVLGELGLVTSTDEPVAESLTDADVAALVRPPAVGAGKRDTGVVLVLAGSPGMAGAAVLVARGALSAGAGLVTVATADTGLVTAAVPEALTAEVDVTQPQAALETLRAELADADAMVVGPGLGHVEAVKRLVRQLVREVQVPLILDADGLNVFRHDGEALADHATPLLVVTPHRRELARLLVEDVWEERAERVPAFAAQVAAVVVAKGPGSLVAAPDGRVWVNTTGGPALATGGTGDVLSGILGALVARQTRGVERIAAGVHLHGLAGDLAAAEGHSRSVTALDVAAGMPAALRQVEASTARVQARPHGPPVYPVGHGAARSDSHGRDRGRDGSHPRR